MGGGPSKILSYDEAVKRFLPADLERIEGKFRDLTAPGINELTITNFKRDVFANFLPEKLASRLFQVVANSSKPGMSLKDLVCCLALIYYGTKKERMQLLYMLFTYNISNSNGVLRWQDVKNFLSQCGEDPPEELDITSENDEIVTQERFEQWLERHKGHTTTITDWLMDEKRLHELTASSIDKASDQYTILAKITHLSDIEIKDLEITYNRLCSNANVNRQQQMILETFCKILSPVLPPILIPGLFFAFDENSDACIDYTEYVCGISAVCRGESTEKYRFLFRVFDSDCDGRLGRSDIVRMCSCLIDVAQFIYVPCKVMNDSPDIYADNILQKIENNTMQKITYFNQEDFIRVCSTDSLIAELLELILQVCHVVLGLRPSTKEEEVSIVKNFLRREKFPFTDSKASGPSKYHWTHFNRSTTKPGSPWYLISMDWLRRWEESPSLPNPNESTGTNIHKKNSSTKLNKLTNGSDIRRDAFEIDNSLLLEKNSSNNIRSYNDDCVQLKIGLRIGVQYEILPESLWLFLRKYYQYYGPVICRKVTYNKTTNKPELDIYPFLLKVYRHQQISQQQFQNVATNSNNNNNQINNNNNIFHSTFFAYPLLNFMSTSIFSSGNSFGSTSNNMQRYYFACSYLASPYQTVRSLAEELAKKYGKTLEETRLHLRINENNLHRIDFESSNELDCRSAGLEQNSEIVCEIRNNDLTWPEELYDLTARPKSTTDNANNNSTNIIEEERRGLIGLSNLGNTCFLNAAVQCLSHTFSLTFYFLHKYHLYEINKSNPIGMQGNIAIRYGQLISKLWGNIRGPLAPFELRDSVAKFGSSRFTEFQQHDAQEFLSFLLDGLHEDLNRVQKKPYVELKDSDNRPDEDVAYEHWSNHLARNTSIIVDLFHGLLRSQVKCCRCNSISVRFDPFNILSLPLPMDTSVYTEIKLVRLNGSRPTLFGLKLNSDLTVGRFKAELSNLSSMPVEQIEFFETTSYSLRRQISMDNNNLSIKLVNLRDTVAYEIPTNSTIDPSSDDKTSPNNSYLPYIKAVHRRLEPQKRYLSPMTRHKIIFFGQPLIIPLIIGDNKQMTNLQVYNIVLQQLERFIRKNNDSIYGLNYASTAYDMLRLQYPFTLKRVTEDGKRCSLCTWNRFCLGCPFEPDQQPFNCTSETIVIEWDSAAYYLRYLSNREQDLEIDTSAKTPASSNRASISEESLSAVRLEDCVESFTKWENLDQKELFNCKTCQDLGTADKKLDIWKLPPCLIFHIKRFQLSNNRWIKSYRPIRFPITSFHPAKYLAPRSSSHSSLQFHAADENLSSSSSSLSSSTAAFPEVTASPCVNNMLVVSSSHLMNGNCDESCKELPPPETITDTMKKKKKYSFKGGRKRRIELDSQETMLSPPRFSQMHDRTISMGDNSFDADNAAYNLYALVCHYGVINGGHYVAYVKNHRNQQWYCFNDSSCKPVSESDIEQCSSSAYLLFYEREGLDHRCYMPNVEGRKPVVSESEAAGEDRSCCIM